MQNLFDLTGKVAIVTGAGAGIGKAVASEFAKEGAKVVIGELRPEVGEKTAKEIESRLLSFLKKKKLL